jgi:hypothetical protein
MGGQINVYIASMDGYMDKEGMVCSIEREMNG